MKETTPEIRDETTLAKEVMNMTLSDTAVVDDKFNHNTVWGRREQHTHGKHASSRMMVNGPHAIERSRTVEWAATS